MADYLQEDEVAEKVYDRVLLKRLLLYLKPYMHLAAAGLLLLIVVSVLELAGPILFKYAIDNYITQNDYSGLRNIAVVYIAILLAGFYFHYAHSYIMQLIGQKVMFDVRMEVFRHLQKMSVSFFDTNPVGRLMTRLTSDVNTLNEMFTSGVVSILGDLLTLAGIVTILLVLNIKLALITFAVLPFLFIVSFWFRSNVRVAYSKIRKRLAQINSFMQENIIGMKIVQLFNHEKINFKKFSDYNQDHTKAHLETIFYFAVFFPAVEIISTLAISLIIWYGGGKVVSNMITLGGLVAFVQYAQRFYRPIQDLSEKYNILISAMASSERIFKLLETKPAVSEAHNAVELVKFQKAIEFKNVWFAYKDDNYVIKDLSFKVKKGEKVAIVGATGGGKSTLINLLARFYDIQKGSILLDGIDIRNVSFGSLRKQMAIVLQDVFLYSGKIEDNINLKNENITYEKMLKAADLANASGFINNLSNGFKSELVERGSNLSTGQKQLLSFARALAFDPEILILDEATSSIDTETEILIQDALEKMMRNRTSIVIAHRLSTIKNADRILVMHRGRLKEMGTHQELLQRKEIYYKLYQLQFKDQEMQAESKRQIL